MGCKQSLYILQVLWAAGDRLHDQKILYPRKTNAYTTEVMIHGPSKCRALEGQIAKNDVDVDARTRVPHEQYTASARKLKRVLNAWMDVILSR